MGLKPAFITGANSKIIIGDKILAFASDVNFTVDVQVIPIEVIGRIEVLTYEPVAYSASGSMNVMRYTGAMIKAANMAGTTVSADSIKTAPAGNAANDIAQKYEQFGAHFDINKYMTSETFDQAVYVYNGTDWLHVYTLNNCRLTRRGNALTKRGVMVDAYSFVATSVTDASENPSKLPG